MCARLCFLRQILVRCVYTQLVETHKKEWADTHQNRKEKKNRTENWLCGVTRAGVHATNRDKKPRR